MKRKPTSRVTSKRIRAVQRKAKFAGFLYLIGAIAIAAFSCLTLLTAKDGSFESGIMGCYKPFIEAFKAEGGFKVSVAMVASLLYILMLVAVIINVFKCFSCMKVLFKKGKLAGGVYRSGYSVYAEPESRSINDNREAMEEIGALFSGSLAAFLIIHFFIYLLCGGASVTLFGYVAVAVGLFFHFLCGILGSKVTVFHRESSEMRYFYHYRFPKAQGNVAHRSGVSVSEASQLFEKDRVVGVSIFFLRNLVQVIFVFALMYAITRISVMSTQVADLLKFDFANLDVMALIPLVIELVLCIWLAVLIKHATAATEFNRNGMEGAGMKNFKIFGILMFITSLGSMAWTIIDGGSISMSAILLIVIAMFAFIADFVIHPKDREKNDKDNLFADGARILGDEEEF
ncbi:MAG: hypothetical protein IJX87_05920 [Clostridia bacterium]|nr:hypothetical protein [Clostridia bacterium]